MVRPTTEPLNRRTRRTITGLGSARSRTITSHSAVKNADAQTGTAQTVSGTRRYDAFGNVVTSIGIWNGPFGYAGGFGYQEDSTGLKLLGHRYYDSSTGRFLTRDPIKDGRNWFIYCESDPLSFIDNNGREPITIVVIGVLVVATVATVIKLIKDGDDFIKKEKEKKEADARIPEDSEVFDRRFLDGEHRAPANEDRRTSIKEAGQEVAKGIRDVYIIGVPGKIIGAGAGAVAAEGTDFGGTGIAELIEGIIGQGVSAGDDFRKGDGNKPWLIP